MRYSALELIQDALNLKTAHCLSIAKKTQS